MPYYLIEIPHSDDAFQCKQAIKLFVTSGSHLLANAHFGCKDGVHKCWFISDFENREQALQIIPAYYKRQASIIELVKFDKESIAKLDHDKK